MKRVALLTIFFYCCTFSAPQQSRAAIPLAIVAATAIGASLLATSSGTYYAQEGKSPEYVSATANAVASASDYVFQPAYLAIGPITLVTAASFPNKVSSYLATTNAVGIGLNDLWNAVKDNPSEFPDLSEIFDSASTTPEYALAQEGQFAPGSTVIFSDSDGTNKKIIIPSDGTWNRSYQYIEKFAWCLDLRPPLTSVYQIGTSDSSYIYLSRGSGALQLTKWVPGYNGWFTCYEMFIGDYTDTNDPATNPPPNATIDYETVKNALNNPSSSVAAEIREAIKANPGSAVTAGEVPSTAGAQTAPNTITQAQINQLLKENTAAVAQAAADAAAAVAAANPTDAAAQIAASQAATEAAQAAEEANTKEETFSPISDSPFGTAYNPGQFDIPTRFTTFLQNVKSSGLFSFSSAFFNSLPGGGSSQLTINGGQTFGTHTFDFSQSLGGGLAILKSVLLALFGFLSIRAVIMKR